MSVEYNQGKIVDIIKHIHKESDASLDEKRCTYILENIVKALHDKNVLNDSIDTIESVGSRYTYCENLLRNKNVLNDIIETIASVGNRYTYCECDCCDLDFAEAVQIVKKHITCLEDIVISPVPMDIESTE